LHNYIYLAQKIEKWKERKAKDNPDIRPTPSTLCNICKHRIDYNTCKAFPNGIPGNLYNKPHLEKHPEQVNDVVFELGEEGSNNAGIKPIKNYRLVHHRLVRPQGIEGYRNIKKGLIEEKWYEKDLH